MAETQQLRDGCVAIAGDVAKMHTLAVNRHGIGVVRVVGFGYEFELLAGLEFLSANAIKNDCMIFDGSYMVSSYRFT